MSKNLTKDDLEEDLLLEYSSRILHFYQENKSTVIGGGSGLVIALGLLIGYFFYAGQQSSKAEQLMVQAETLYRAGNFEQALYGDDATFTVGFVQIASNYGSTDAGNLAHYYVASSHAELGQYEEALSAIEKYNAPKGILGVAPRALHAKLLSEAGLYDLSAKKYEEAAGLVDNESTTPVYLLSAAKAYLEAGDQTKAEALLDRIIANYRNSQYASSAQNIKGRIG